MTLTNKEWTVFGSTAVYPTHVLFVFIRRKEDSRCTKEKGDSERYVLLNRLAISIAHINI